MPSRIDFVDGEAITISVDGKKVLLKPRNPNCRATCTTAKEELAKDPNEPLAVDVEFQEYRPIGEVKWRHRIGRIAVVNTRGKVVYDVCVRYEYDETIIIKMPPKRYGVEYKDLQICNGAKEILEVVQVLRKLFSGRLIIGHGMRLDKTAIGEEIWEEDQAFFDTQQVYGQKKLCYLAAEYLEGDFEFHDPTEDARATMLLYLRLHPYQGRHDFEELPFTKSEEDFPSLAAAAAAGKQ